MAKIKYVGSTGLVMDLSSFPVRIRQKTAGFYSYAWTANVTNKSIGTRVNSFGKDAKTYEVTIDFTGTRSARASAAQEFYEITERDVRNTTAENPTPGKLYLGDSYVECYIVSSESVTYENNTRTIGKKFEMYVPYPFWIEEITHTLEQFETQEESEYLDFSFDFDFDLTASALGTLDTLNDNFVDSEFKLIIYGPATNPYITVNSHVHRVNTTLLAGESLIINSKEYTITKVSSTGAKTNALNLRDKNNDVFRKIPTGNLQIGWTGDFKAELILMNERSEPRWT